MQEIRCGQCAKKLGAGEYRRLSIKCPRCGALNELRAESPEPERQGASEVGVSIGSFQPDHPLARRKTPSR